MDIDPDTRLERLLALEALLRSLLIDLDAGDIPSCRTKIVDAKVIVAKAIKKSEVLEPA